MGNLSHYTVATAGPRRISYTMIMRLKSFAENIYLNHTLAFALLLAFVIRSVAAWRNYGPFAVDDYQNVIEPALRYLMLGDRPEIPSLRFEILPYAFAWFMKPLYFLGVKRADHLVSFAYFIMGAISLLQIVAMHRIGAIVLKPAAQRMLTIFAATWAIAPLFTNSADIAGPSYICMSFAVLHLLRATHAGRDTPQDEHLVKTNRALLWCGFFLSAAIFFRFSLAPLYFALAVYLVFAQAAGTRFKGLLFFGIGGAITAALMSLLETLNGKLPFSTALEFVKYNFDAHIATQSYGSMPWHMYIGIILLFPIPLLACVFWWPMLKSARRFTGLTVLFMAFLISHSAIAFKLERYVIPVVPILMIWLFAGIEAFADRRFMRIAVTLLFIFNTILIAPVALTMLQRAGVDGAIYAGGLKPPQIVYGIDPWRWGYYGLKRPAPVFARTLAELEKSALAAGWPRFSVFRFMYFTAAEKKRLSALGIDCRLTARFEPDYLERLSIRLNPAMNYRRNDTTVYECKTGADGKT
jgi:hypothetical protein